MALDQAVIGQVVAAQMEALERDYARDESAQIAGVITIVQVVTRESETEIGSNVRMRTNIPDPYAVIGILRMAENGHIRQLTGDS